MSQLNVRLLTDRYEIGKSIGQGGMGEVFWGRDLLHNQPVAIKQLKLTHTAIDQNRIERFSREAEALQQLNHPNIVQLIEKIEFEDTHFIVMEYVSGGSLEELLAQLRSTQRTLSLTEVIQIGLEVADALTRAHHLKIIHRDLKPSNILRTTDGNVRLSDFGIAYFDITHQRHRITDSGDMVGTLDYMSPEALMSSTVDARSDIWAFGVVLFELLTGIHPFRAASFAETLNNIITQPVDDLEALRPDCPVALADLVYQLLQKDPIRRVPTMRMAGALLEMLAENSPFSPLESSRFGQEAAQGDTANLHKTVRHNLPSPVTAFVGRDNETAELQKLLLLNSLRLITIMAQGGMGKTRLALATAQKLLVPQANHPFLDGIYFIELAPLSSLEGIIQSVAEAIGYTFVDNTVPHRQQLLHTLQDKQVLLIFDNFEHLVNGAGWVGEIVERAAGVKVLVTSRERLNLQGETIFRLSGLDIPSLQLTAHALEYSAIQLFLQSARYAQPGFELSDSDCPLAIQICRFVEGLPLGIVLAAGWVDVLGLDDILREVQKNSDFLETQAPNIPERQRSLRAVFDYSWKHLDAEAKRALMQLAVFRGSFSRDAVQAITGTSLRTLIALVNKSLLERDPETGRYYFHALLRQYAEHQLDNAGLAQKTRDAHSQYYLNFMYERRTLLRGQNADAVLDQFEADMENIRVAWSYAIDMKRFDLIQKAMDGLVLL